MGALGTPPSLLVNQSFLETSQPTEIYNLGQLMKFCVLRSGFEKLEEIISSTCYQLSLCTEYRV